MKIVGFESENMASTHLRVRQWVQAMRLRGHDADFYNDGLDDVARFDERVRGADIVLYGHTHDTKKVALLQAGRKLYGYKIVCDTDDLVSDIPAYNFASASYNNAVWFKRLAIAQYRDADAVTVSTEYLKEATSVHNPRCHLVPNCVDMNLWSGVRKRLKEARHRDDIRIYWGGGGGHWDDVMLVKDALLRVYHENPRVKLIFSNFVPAWAASLSPHRIFFLPLVPYRSTWQRILTWLCIDIGLAPLTANDFNRAKSHVKYLDYAMAGIAGVYQDIDAYESVVDGLTGLKATTEESWYGRISTLVGEPTLRKRLGEQARRDVEAHWTVDAHAVQYERLLRQIRSVPCVEVVALEEGIPVEASQWAT